MSERVLVTGCAGYIGSTLVGHLLAAGHRVVGVDRLMFKNGHAVLPYLGHPDFTFYREDVRNALPVQHLASRCDTVIMLAALVGAPLCDRARAADVEAVNYWAVRSMVKSLSPRQLVLYPNTNSGYGSTDGTSECTEADALAPISLYGVTKCQAERAVLDHPQGISFRLATVFGASPRMRLDLMVNDFTRRVCVARELSIFEPQFKRNFVGVQDVARAFIHAMRCSAVKPGAYNIGLPSANLTKMELALRIAAELQLPPERVTVGDGKDPDRRNYLVSNAKILAAGFSFRHELVQGIREVAKVVGTHTPEQLAQMSNV